jgi:hypothetical protein
MRSDGARRVCDRLEHRNSAWFAVLQRDSIPCRHPRATRARDSLAGSYAGAGVVRPRTRPAAECARRASRRVTPGQVAAVALSSACRTNAAVTRASAFALIYNCWLSVLMPGLSSGRRLASRDPMSLGALWECPSELYVMRTAPLKWWS